MKYLPGNIRFVFLYLTISLIFNELLRLTFFIYHYNHFSQSNIADILLAFLYGIRFDLPVIILSSGWLFLLLSLPILPLQIQRWHKAANFLFLITLLPAIALNLIDIAHFGFSSKRLTYELTGMVRDIMNFWWKGVQDYWPLSVIAAVFMYSFYWLLQKSSAKLLQNAPLYRYKRFTWLIPSILFCLFVIGVRGGIQIKPLRPAMAFFAENRAIGYLTLNTPYSIASSFSSEKEQLLAIIPEKEAIKQTRKLCKNKFDNDFESEEYSFLRTTNFVEPEKKLNVVIIILESFTGDFVGCLNGSRLEHSFTPNFDTLAQKGLLFTHFYANATRSMEAVPAILNGQPHVMQHSIIASEVETAPVMGLGRILQKRGYHTSFFHGAQNGSMGFDSYARISGIKHYIGLSQYPAKYRTRDYDGTWGIYDEPFFLFWSEYLNKIQQPFFSVLFTLSNHHPYKLPDTGYEFIQQKNIHQQYKTLMYSDLSLGKFFQSFSKTPAFENTIFVITADHCFSEEWVQDRRLPDFNHIPLLLYAPKHIKPGIANNVGCHAAILPTIIELLRLKTEHSSIAPSLLDSTKSFALTRLDEIYTWIQDSTFIASNFNGYYEYGFKAKPGNVINWVSVGRDDSRIQPARKEGEKNLIAYTQAVKNLTIQGKWYFP